MPGRKISRANMQRIQEIANHAYAMGAKGPEPDRTPLGGKADLSLNDQLEVVARAVYGSAMAPMDGYCCIEETFDTYVIIEVCQGGGVETYWRADYSIDDAGAVTLAARDAWMQVEEVWQPVAGGGTAKAGLMVEDAATPHYASIKALADRQLEVKVSYYGHKGGKDSHQEFFDADTDFAVEDFPAPPLLYYHGFDSNGKKMGKPITTGKFVSRRAGDDGHYLTYKLKNNKYADRQWDSALKGTCVVSPGTVGHLIRKAANGHLDYWPLAEVSAWDYAPNRAPANLHSVAAPILKALYVAEGLPLPAALDSSPETEGDSVSADAPRLSIEEIGKIMAESAAAALLSLRKGTH